MSPGVDPVTLTRRDFEDLVSLAAERGARRALERVGLSDRDAIKDITEIRGLLDAWRDIKKTTRRTATKWLVYTGLGAIALGAIVKVKIGF